MSGYIVAREGDACESEQGSRLVNSPSICRLWRRCCVYGHTLLGLGVGGIRGPLL